MSVSLIDGHIDEPRMTDNEIIKALECCTEPKQEGCSHCLIADKCISGEISICDCVLDLINRQKEQINGLIAGQETLQKHLAEKNKEVESLKNAYKQCAWERDIFLEELKMVGE